MTKANDEFTYTLDVIFGVGTPVQLLCVENGINNHRKLKSKWRNIRNLEYTDSTTNTKVTLSDDYFEEFAALVPFKNHMQNELGLVSKNPVDITQYSREDFSGYYDFVYDPEIENPTQYEQVLAQAAEKHAGEMKILAACTASAMTTTGGTTTTANPSGGSPSGGTSGGGVTNPDLKAELKALKKAGVPDVKKYILN